MFKLNLFQRSRTLNIRLSELVYYNTDIINIAKKYHSVLAMVELKIDSLLIEQQPLTYYVTLISYNSCINM